MHEIVSQPGSCFNLFPGSGHSPEKAPASPVEPSTATAQSEPLPAVEKGDGDAKARPSAPRKEPKSGEEWRKELNKSDGFLRLTNEMMTSDAFLSLRQNGKVLLLVAYAQTRLEKKPKLNKRRPRLVKDTLVLTCAMCALFGVKARATREKAIEDLIRHGFLDVVESGSYLKAAIFRRSDRWMKWPGSGSEIPKGMPPIGKSLYPDYGYKPKK
jgi:hypothetical protein